MIEGVNKYLQKRRAQRKNEAAADRAARRTANATWVIAFFTFGTIAVGFLQFLILHRQLTEMQLAREADERAKRPVLRLTKHDPVSITVDDTRATIDLDLWTTNIGQSPAAFVYFGADVIPDITGDPTQRLERVCSETRIGQDGHAVEVLDAGKQMRLREHTFRIDLADVRSAFETQIKKIFVNNSEGLGRALSFPVVSGFSIVGCLTYSYGNEHTVGQTPVRIDVGGRCKRTNPGVTCPFAMDRPVVYRPYEIIVRQVRMDFLDRQKHHDTCPINAASEPRLQRFPPDSTIFMAIL